MTEAIVTVEPADPTGPKPTAPEAPKVEGTDWQAQARKWEARAKENSKAATELEQLRTQAMSDQEKAVNAAKTAGYTEALTKANKRLVSAEARALAAGAKFRDPGDAVKFLTLDDISVDEDGNVDASAIKSALEELAKSKPYLLDDGKAPAPSGDIGQGHRTGPAADPRVADLRQIEADLNAGKRR
jgi:hypothetical protein